MAVTMTVVNDMDKAHTLASHVSMFELKYLNSSATNSGWLILKDSYKLITLKAKSLKSIT
jgi:hypothetical protein